jgi:predicted DNA-binding protein (MmcQ/YjbR family)
VKLDAYRDHCLAKKGVTEEFPFDENVLVFKVMGKLFALLDVNTFESVNLKVDPEKGAELQEQYAAVQPGYHMNKKHWVTVLMDGSIPPKMVLKWTDESYDLVVLGLTKKQKSALEAM